jgi:hypothetical protein
MDKKLKVRRITEVSSIFVQKEASGNCKVVRSQFHVTDVEPNKKDSTLIDCVESPDLFIPLIF